MKKKILALTMLCSSMFAIETSFTLYKSPALSGEDLSTIIEGLNDAIDTGDATLINNAKNVVTTPTPPASTSVDCSSATPGDTITIGSDSVWVANDSVSDIQNKIFNDGWNASLICTTHVTDMSSLFSAWSGGTADFNQDISKWDVSNVTSMEYMFEGTEEFNQAIGNWDVSNVTNMEGMFSEAMVFNQPLNSWNVSNVDNMYYMFGDAYEFNQPLNSWNMSNVTNIAEMFSYAEAFNGDISNWDTSKVTDTSYMFYGALVFNQDISSWNVSNVTTMEGMFNDSTAFNQDISNWDVSSTTNMNYLFWNAENFNQDLSGWCVTNIATKPTNFDMNSDFEGIVTSQPNWGTCGDPIPVATSSDCSSATPGTTTIIDGNTYYVAANKADITNNIDGTIDGSSYTGSYAANRICTSHVTDMSSLFYNEENFNQDIGNWDVSNVTTFESMFQGSMSGPFGAEVLTFTTFNQDISKWDVSSATNMDYMFEYSQNFDQDLSSWCVTNIATKPTNFDMNSGFHGQIYKKPNWGTCGDPYSTEIVYNANYVTIECPTGLPNTNVTAFGKTWWIAPDDVDAIREKIFNDGFSASLICTSHVTNMSKMFYSILNGSINSTIFNQAIGNWDTSNVTNMSEMFFHSTKFQANISKWNVSNVTNMAYMFHGAALFNSSVLSWDVSSVTTMKSMFGDNDSGRHMEFNKSLSTWDTSNVIDMSYMFDSSDSFNNGGVALTFDTSSVTTMAHMFSYAKVFNQDISSWDTSNVGEMGGMFSFALAFNQDISSWNANSETSGMGGQCVDASSTYTPQDFDLNSGFEGLTIFQPTWNTCP